MKRATFFAVLLLIVTTPVLFLELALRYVGLGAPIVYEIDYAYRYSLAPDQHVKRRRSATVSVNASGLRALEPWQGVVGHKVLFVGDSVTYGGSYIDDSEIFSEVFCAQKKLLSDQPIVCGNAGINSYGILNMSMRLRHDARIQDADTIVIVILPGDAVRGLVDGSMHHYPTTSPGHFFRATHEMATYLSSRAVLRLAKKIDYVPKNGATATAFALDHLKETVQLKQGEGTSVFIVVSPPNDDLTLNKAGGRSFLEVLAQRFPAHIQLGRALEGVHNAYYDRVHFEVNGHRAVGLYLADKIFLGETALNQ